VFVEPSDALPLVTVLVAFRSGSTHDAIGKEGVARLTARMLRRGGGGRTARDIEETFDALGGEFGADCSASATSVHFEVIRRNVDAFVDLVASLLAKPAFDVEELERLKREAAAEIVEARDSDRSLVGRAFRRTFFAGHPYGRRVAGTLASIASITRDDVAAHAARHYTRSNAVVAVSGDVTRAEGDAIAARLLAGLPEGEALADPAPEPEGKRGRHLVLVDKPDRTQTQLVVGGLGTHAHDPDHVALLVANIAFGGTFTSRLMQEVRVKRGWSYGAYARAGFDRRRDAFTMSAAPAAADAAACLALELELLHAFRKDGVTKDELDFVKRYVVRSHAFEVDTARKRVHQPLEAELFGLPAGYHARYLEHVEAVTVESANAAVAKRVPEADLVIALVCTRAELGDALEKAVPDLDSVTVLPVDFE
jgi:zinc protease